MTRLMHQDAAATAVLRRTMVLLLMLLMFSLSSFPSVTAKCPEKCTCKNERVHCSNQELVRIPDRIPPATETLTLCYNYISEVKNGSFSNLSKLRTLSLNGNKIENIETGAFNNLTSLEHLYLYSNKIHKLDLEMFKGLTKLNELDLDDNMIRKIPPGIFDSLTSLIRLSLTKSNISEVKNGVFSNLSKLQTLSLNGNKIENFETGAFNNLTCLESLYMDSNKIHKLDLEMFKGLSKLKRLYLGYNMIRKIPPGIFDSLTSLSQLSLTNSNISEVKNGAFSNLSKLWTLSLNGNKIENIETGAFDNLTCLEFLYLDSNKIHKLNLEMFMGLKKLKRLSLTNNYISEVKNGVFSNLSKLRMLSMNNNKIENIETGAFNNLTSLEHLDLDFNQIHKLNLEMFKGLTKLKYLYLGDNMIRKIPPWKIDSLTSLSRLRLDHNPLICDCNILWFVNTLKKNYPRRDVFRDYDPSCHFPEEMSEKSLKEITENDFHCKIKTVSVSVTVSVGEQLQLSCKAVGDPEPFITWSKDEIDLEFGQRIQVFQNNTLIISKVEKTDGGDYKCVASNSLGKKSFETMVNVNEKCPPLEADSLDIRCTHNGKYANCSNPSIPDTIAKTLCKPLYPTPNGHGNEPLELFCQPNGAWDKELYICNSSCGKIHPINKGMILGGGKAPAVTAPWNVGVYRIDKINSNNYDLICGGSIISPNLVVSAAHCFWETGMLSNRISVNDGQYKIAVGKYSRNITIIDNEFTKIMNVETVHLNEYYYGYKGFHADDIAIVVLRDKISFSIGVSPICVDWIGLNTIPNGAKGKIVGWGITEKGIASPNLLEASLPYINHTTCRNMYRNGFESYVTTDKFCAGSALGQGVHDGDSGAGLSFLHSNLSYLIGVASVKDTETDDSISAFTEVQHHIQWIRRLYTKYN